MAGACAEAAVRIAIAAFANAEQPVSAKACSFFYLPDVARLPSAATTLRGILTYIGLPLTAIGCVCLI
jgi:hypothetical protein